MAVSVGMLHGHDPRDIREWPYRDVERLLAAHFAQPRFVGAD